MKKKRVLLILGMLLFALLLWNGVQAMDSDHYAIDWMVPMDSSGGGKSTSTNFIIQLTVGQSVVGHSSSSDYTTGLGYWYGLFQEIWTYLPILFKGGS